MSAIAARAVRIICAKWCAVFALTVGFFLAIALSVGEVAHRESRVHRRIDAMTGDVAERAIRSCWPMAIPGCHTIPGGCPARKGRSVAASTRHFPPSDYLAGVLPNDG
jgi:hypothetical protein